MARIPREIPGYRLLDKIGEGGMGEVHRATQLSLQRTVAIKFLHPVAAGKGALSGIGREARVSGALAHPHIVTTYDCGSVDGQQYLIMEYVDGSTLRGSMEPGRPMPIEQAAPVIDAIARALGYIHQQGILHLDLKPENVLCTGSRTIKITDFGLASPESYSCTVPETERSQGTLDYCAPEQRHGLAVDQRSDVFALATLAYELLTGDLPSRVYVPATEMNPRLPRAVNEVLRRGLARDPEERFSTVEEFRKALTGALGIGQRRSLVWPLMAVGAAVLVIWLPMLCPEIRRRNTAAQSPVPPAPALPSFESALFAGDDVLLYPSNRMGVTGIFVLHPDGSRLVNLTPHAGRSLFPACSPDGKTIAFTRQEGGFDNIFVMDSDGGNVRQLTKAAGDNRAPAWSPDGRRLAFVSDRDGNSEIYVMNADGSNSVNLTNDPGFDADPAWSPDGTKIAFASHRDGQHGCRLCVMDADGQHLRVLTQKDNPFGFVYPCWSPDGKEIAYGDRLGPGKTEVFALPAEGGQPRQLTNLGGVNGLPAWSRDGKRIAFLHQAPGDECASLYLMGADGADVRALFEFAGPLEGGRPAWKRIDP